MGITITAKRRSVESPSTWFYGVFWWGSLRSGFLEWRGEGASVVNLGVEGWSLRRNCDWKQMLASKDKSRGKVGAERRKKFLENSQAWVLAFWALPGPANQSLALAQLKGVSKAGIGAEAFHGVRGSRCPGKGVLTPSRSAVKEKWKHSEQQLDMDQILY